VSDRRSRTVTVDFDARRREFGGDDRGVSDVVGYVLVFSLITITIGTVFAVGIAGVEDRREAERVANVERAFDVFDDNLRDIQRYGDPSRATEVRLAGGTLATSGETRFALVNSTDPAVAANATDDWNADSLVYRDGETTIAYEAGALVRGDGGGSVLLSGPRFVAADGRTTIPIVGLESDSDDSVSGDGTVQVTVAVPERYRERNERSSDSSETTVLTPSSEDTYLHVETDHPEAWRGYFARTNGFEPIDVDTDGVAVARLREDGEIYVHDIERDVFLRR